MIWRDLLKNIKIQLILKKSISLDKTDKDTGIKKDFSTSVSGDKCGKSCRVALKECFARSSTAIEKKQCAGLFVKSYSRCFFGDVKNVEHEDISVCQTACLSRFDGCNLYSSKVEEGVCLNSRRVCYSICSPSATTAVKRTISCHDCSTERQMCEDHTDDLGEYYICLRLNQTCKELCRWR